MADSFPALRERNFRLYLTGNLVSFSGAWMQITAEGWLVKEMTHSAYWVSFVATVPWIVTTFLATFSGIVVDKHDHRTILWWTNALSMAQAVILGVLILTHSCELWHVISLAFCLGLIASVDSPTRNAFLPQIVSNKNLLSAGALNSGMINLAQVLGSAIGAFSILQLGIGWTVIVNAFSFLAAIFMLHSLELRETDQIHKETHPFLMLKEGAWYIWRHNQLLFCILLSGILSMTGFSFRSVLPVASEELLHRGVEGLGYLSAAASLGCLGAAYVLSRLAHAVPTELFVLGGSLLCGTSLILVSFAASMSVVLLLFFIAGLGFILAFTTLRTTIQAVVRGENAGRVMGIVITASYGGLSLGNLLTGTIAERYGCRTAFLVCGSALTAITFALLPLRSLLSVKRLSSP